MKNIKVVFTDIDGTTFINGKKIVIESTYLAFKKLKAKGIKIVICTTRSYEETLTLPKEYLEYIDAIICSTGAQIVADGKNILLHTIEKKETSKIIDFLESNNFIYRYITKDLKGYLNSKDKHVHEVFNYYYGFVPTQKDYQDEDVVSILCYLKDSNPKYQKFLTCTSNISLINLVDVQELNPLGINKGTGIIDFCNYYKIKLDDTICIGDSYNDIDMLKVCKNSVCMGNGVQEAKDIASYVTDDITKDGFYNAMKYYKIIK